MVDIITEKAAEAFLSQVPRVRRLGVATLS